MTPKHASLPSDVNLMQLDPIFSEQGPLSGIMTGYRRREEQVILASQIQAAFWHSEHCMAEAGTGVGKSLAYLIPGIDWALKNKTRLMVSTHTKALQTQLMQKELPLLLAANIFERPFRYEICLGVENYVCLLRLLRMEDQMKLPGFDVEDAGAVHAVMTWCRDQVSGVRFDCPAPVPDPVWRDICIVNELCLGRRCAYYSDCFLQLARQRQRDADVLVANHYLFFSNIAANGKLLPEFNGVVMDEAHKVEDVAGAFLGDTIAEHDVLHLLTEISRRGRGSFLDSLRSAGRANRDKIRQLAGHVLAQQTQWWQSVGTCWDNASDTWRVRETPDGLARPDVSDLLLLAETLGEIGRAAENDEEGKLLSFYETDLRNIAVLLEAWYDRGLDDSVYWVQRQKGPHGESCRIHTTPMDLSRRLRTMVFENFDSVVLTSATLAVNHDFSYYRARLGISEAREVVTDSTFAYEEQAAVYLPESMPDPKAVNAYEERVISEVDRLIDLFGGGMFVLCTSHRMLRSMKKALLSKAADYTILTQGEKPPDKLLQMFMEDQNAVMLGVETFWQGVDVPGDALRCVVITRLPFDVPTHPVHEARAEYLTALGENPFMTYFVPRAALMLRQGFGRLIRHHDDRGVVAILDARVRTRSWGRRFLQALPPCRQLHHQQDVEKFVKNHFVRPLGHDHNANGPTRSRRLGDE